MLEKLRAEAEKPAFVSRTRPAARYAALAASFVILVAAVIAMPMVLSGQFPLFEIGRREASPANEPSYYGDNGAPSAGDAPPSVSENGWAYPYEDEERNGAMYNRTRSHQEEADLNEAPPAANPQSGYDWDIGDGNKPSHIISDDDDATDGDGANGYSEGSHDSNYDCRLCQRADGEFCFSTALNALIRNAETVEELRETARYCHKVRSITVRVRVNGSGVTSGELTPGMIVQITMEDGSFTETLVTE
jgi:hypothetical protein